MSKNLIKDQPPNTQQFQMDMWESFPATGYGRTNVDYYGENMNQQVPQMIRSKNSFAQSADFSYYRGYANQPNPNIQNMTVNPAISKMQKGNSEKIPPFDPSYGTPMGPAGYRGPFFGPNQVVYDEHSFPYSMHHPMTTGYGLDRCFGVNPNQISFSQPVLNTNYFQEGESFSSGQNAKKAGKEYTRSAQQKITHNQIERKRRDVINECIRELDSLVPPHKVDVKRNKGAILKATVDFIKNRCNLNQMPSEVNEEEDQVIRGGENNFCREENINEWYKKNNIERPESLNYQQNTMDSSHNR